MAMMAPQAEPATMSASDTSEAEGSGTAPTFSAAARTNAVVSPATSAPGVAGAHSSVDQMVAVQLEKKAEVGITRVRAQFAAAQSSLSTTTIANIQSHLDQFDATVRVGDDALASQDYAAARASFTSAFKTTIELGTLITASQTFKKDFVKPVSRGTFNQNSVSAGVPVFIEGSASSSVDASAGNISNTTTSGGTGSSAGTTSSPVNVSGNASGAIVVPPPSSVVPIGL
ncbi:MAG TPA: hypothetical protein VG753_02210, partial [Candidatus Paceibacterota bacterium]|nr:hypothetical protein [Candidatus Paceibacterota bacterium]